MMETEITPAASPPAEPDAEEKPTKTVSAAGGAKKFHKKPSGPSVSELILKAVAASKERSGVSLAALKKALAAGGYDVVKNSNQVNIAVSALVTKGDLQQVKGSGSFKINKKQHSPKSKVAHSKKKKPSAAAKRKRPAAAAKKAPKSPKKKRPTNKAKSPKKKTRPTKRPARKSPKKPKSAARRVAKKIAKPKRAAHRKKR